MLWLPKHLKAKGDELEDARPSRRTFLFMAAATAVAAVAPPDPLEGWKFRSFSEAQLLTERGAERVFVNRALYGRIRITGEMMRMQADRNALEGVFVRAMRLETDRVMAEVRAELARIEAVDAAGVHGMVEHHGLIVPKDTPREAWADQYIKGWVNPETFARLTRGEFVNGEGKPAGQVKADEPVYWRQVRRDRRDLKDKL